MKATNLIGQKRHECNMVDTILQGKSGWMRFTILVVLTFFLQPPGCLMIGVGTQWIAWFVTAKTELFVNFWCRENTFINLGGFPTMVVASFVQDYGVWWCATVCANASTVNCCHAICLASLHQPRSTTTTTKKKWQHGKMWKLVLDSFSTGHAKMSCVKF